MLIVAHSGIVQGRILKSTKRFGGHLSDLSIPLASSNKAGGTGF
jgi:hypothetical protein